MSQSCGARRALGNGAYRTRTDRNAPPHLSPTRCHRDHAPPFCHDGTERPIPRPTDSAEQTLHYSGKKKRHTLKNLLLITTTLTILFLSTTFEGTVHDKRIADYSAYPLPPDSQLLQDLGFLAFTLDGVEMREPTKKPRGGTLTPEQKAANQA